MKKSSDIVTRTNEAFAKVITGSKKVGDLVGEIAAASNEQGHGIQQINKAVAEMVKVLQKNVANVEEPAVAAASEETNAQATQMKQFVGLVAGVQESNVSEVSSGTAQHHMAHGRSQGLGVRGSTQEKSTQSDCCSREARKGGY